MKNIILLVVITGLLINCRGTYNEHVKEKLQLISMKLESGDFSEIRSVSTEEGLNSLLLHSDSLRNDSYLKSLALDLKEFNVFSIEDNDSLIILSLGKPDEIVGATSGYVFLIKENNDLKINKVSLGK